MQLRLGHMCQDHGHGQITLNFPSLSQHQQLRRYVSFYEYKQTSPLVRRRTHNFSPIVDLAQPYHRAVHPVTHIALCQHVGLLVLAQQHMV